MQKKSIKLDVDGLILINKPYGLSSNHALTRIKKKFHPKKAGHTGTLDPLAVDFYLFVWAKQLNFLVTCWMKTKPIGLHFN